MLISTLHRSHYLSSFLLALMSCTLNVSLTFLFLATSLFILLLLLLYVIIYFSPKKCSLTYYFFPVSFNVLNY